MRITSLAFLTLVLLLSACKKDVKDSRIIINVKSTSNRKAGVYISSLSDEFKIYTRKDTVSAVSDGNGQLSFNLIPNKTYYLYHYPGDNQTIDPAIASFIKVGIFNSAEEINLWPRQVPPATVGGNRYQDINGDGKVDHDDMVLTITAPAAGKILTVDFPLIDR